MQRMPQTNKLHACCNVIHIHGSTPVRRGVLEDPLSLELLAILMPPLARNFTAMISSKSSTDTHRDPSTHETRRYLSSHRSALDAPPTYRRPACRATITCQHIVCVLTRTP